jgi:hypothetical protein
VPMNPNSSVERSIYSGKPYFIDFQCVFSAHHFEKTAKGTMHIFPLLQGASMRIRTDCYEGWQHVARITQFVIWIALTNRKFKPPNPNILLHPREHNHNFRPRSQKITTHFLQPFSKFHTKSATIAVPIYLKHRLIMRRQKKSLMRQTARTSI